MSATIFHEGPELRGAAQRMATVISSMTNIQSVVAQIYSGMSATWQGRAAEQSARNANTLQTATRDYLADARATKQALDAAVSEYDRREQQQTGKVSQLNTKGIF